MNPIETLNLACPWCDAPLEIDVDLTAGDRCYVEDCQICCAPMVVTLEIGQDPDAEFRVTLAMEGG